MIPNMLKFYSFVDVFFQTAFLSHGAGTIACSPHARHLVFANNKTKSKKIENKPDEVFADFDFVRKEVEEQAQCVTDSKKRMCNETI